jgi:SMI1 / KNR4 family (SUKH-1)
MHAQSDDQLIERLCTVVRAQRYPAAEYAWHRPVVPPPAPEDDVVRAEAQLGFALPPFLRRLYLEVGNGGFGPGYGLFPLDTASDSLDSLVTAYTVMRAMSQQDIDENWESDEDKPSLWPSRVLMICDWGCNIYTLVNCDAPDLPVLRMDSNASFGEWVIESLSLQHWLAAWLDGEPLFSLNWDHAPKVAVARLWEAGNRLP